MRVNLSFLLVANLCLGAFTSVCSAIENRIVTVLNGSFPDQGSDLRFASFTKSYRLTDDGQILFVTASDHQGASRHILWEMEGGHPVARQIFDELVQGVSDTNDFDIASPIFSPGGQVAFVGVYERGGVEQVGYWVQDGVGFHSLVQRGEAAPGFTDAFFRQYRDFAFNDRLDSALLADLSGQGAPPFQGTDGIWTGQGNSLTSLVRVGDSMPGFTEPSSFGFFFPRLALGNDGTAAFAALAENGTQNPGGIWAHRDGEIRLVARQNSQGRQRPGPRFTNLRYVRVTDEGATYFHGFLTGDDVNEGNDQAIWIEDGDELRMVAREGDRPLGTGSPLRLGPFAQEDTVFGDAMVANAHGRVAFSSGSNSFPNSIWAEDETGLQLIARTGDQAPGAADGVFFRLFRPEVAFNDAGQVMFTALLGGPGVSSRDGEGIWATDRSGNLQLVAREGDSLNLPDFPFAEISGLPRVRNEHFDNQGRFIAIPAVFGGPDLLIVFGAVAVPEPTGFLLIVGLLSGLATLRRRSHLLEYWCENRKKTSQIVVAD